ncbi:MAG: PepSY-associated TM helix domain-containing protein, partial [Pseudomonadota bacterium]
MIGSFRQSMTWLHTWFGIVVCWLLYFMFITGTTGYFDEEIDAW